MFSFANDDQVFDKKNLSFKTVFLKTTEPIVQLFSFGS